MTLTGTVVNGLVVFDGPQKFPEGSRIRMALDDEDADLDDMPIPSPAETYEQHLAILRQSIADADAGTRGRSVAESMAELDAELDRFFVVHAAQDRLTADDH